MRLNHIKIFWRMFCGGVVGVGVGVDLAVHQPGQICQEFCHAFYGSGFDDKIMCIFSTLSV